MSREGRVVVAGVPYHITHRGNRREKIFRQEQDWRVYFRMLRKAFAEHLVRIWAYCFMPNHVHLIVIPQFEYSLARAIRGAHGGYAEYFNGVYGTVGHLWEGRFKSSAMDEAHLWNAIRYVERNPVRAGLVVRAEDYTWSSAAAHCGLRSDVLLSNDLPLNHLLTDWSSWLAGRESETVLHAIRQTLKTEKPYASEDFIRQMEQQTGRPILPQKRGPKPRNLGN